MLLTPLDNVFYARPLLSTDHRAHASSHMESYLKLLCLLGLPISMGQPHLADHQCILRLAIECDAFVECLRHGNFRFCLRRAVNPNHPGEIPRPDLCQLAIANLRKPTWRSSAFAGRDPLEVAQYLDKGGAAPGLDDYDKCLAQGLDRLSRLFKVSAAEGGVLREDCFVSPHFGDDIPPLYKLIKLRSDQLCELIDDDPLTSCARRAGQKLRELASEMSTRPPSERDARSVWLSELNGASAEFAAVDPESQTCTRVIISAFNDVLRRSWSADWIDAAEFFIAGEAALQQEHLRLTAGSGTPTFVIHGDDSAYLSPMNELNWSVVLELLKDQKLISLRQKFLRAWSSDKRDFFERRTVRRVNPISEVLAELAEATAKHVDRTLFEARAKSGTRSLEIGFRVAIASIATGATSLITPIAIALAAPELAHSVTMAGEAVRASVAATLGGASEALKQCAVPISKAISGWRDRGQTFRVAGHVESAMMQSPRILRVEPN